MRDRSGTVVMRGGNFPVRRGLVRKRSGLTTAGNLLVMSGFRFKGGLRGDFVKPVGNLVLEGEVFKSRDRVGWKAFGFRTGVLSLREGLETLLLTERLGERALVLVTGLFFCDRRVEAFLSRPVPAKLEPVGITNKAINIERRKVIVLRYMGVSFLRKLGVVLF